MKRSRLRSLLLLMLPAILAGVLILPAVSRLTRAEADRAAAEAAFEDAANLRRDIDRLRASAPTWISRGRPRGDVAALLHSTLRGVNLPVTTLIDVTPQETGPSPSRPDGEARWQESSIQIRLAALPLPDIGAFLDRWRETHAEWTVTSIDLAAVEKPGDPAATANYTAALRLTATFVE